MKKNLGFTRFEFYFVISVISIVTVVGLQRYMALAEESRRFSFEMIARNFSTVIYNYRARWIMAQQTLSDASYLEIEGVNIYFSQSGWPVAVFIDKNTSPEISIISCMSLWQHFLQSPPPISFTETSYGNHSFHLSMPDAQTCRYEFVNSKSSEFFVDYKPNTGEVVFNKQPLIPK